VRAYEQYTVMFPNGERIESAHLNIIDALREEKKYDEANRWVAKTVTKFRGKPSEVNALHAKLRMEIHRENWQGAVDAADDLLGGKSFAGSMASSDEVKYLRAFAQSKNIGCGCESVQRDNAEPDLILWRTRRGQTFRFER